MENIIIWKLRSRAFQRSQSQTLDHTRPEPPLPTRFGKIPDRFGAPFLVYDLRTQNLNFVAPIPEQVRTITMHFSEVQWFLVVLAWVQPTRILRVLQISDRRLFEIFWKNHYCLCSQLSFTSIWWINPHPVQRRLFPSPRGHVRCPCECHKDITEINNLISISLYLHFLQSCGNVLWQSRPVGPLTLGAIPSSHAFCLLCFDLWCMGDMPEVL